MGRPQKFTPEEVAQALRNHYGILYHAALELGCDRKTVQRYVERYAQLREETHQQQERRLDVGENSLMGAVIDREPWAVALLLKTKGKERGYVERTERDISQTTTVVHEHRHRLEALSIDDLEALEAIGAKLTEARSGARRLPGDTIDAGEEEPEMVRPERLSEL